MRCPKCEGECYHDEVDVGVGIITGPWGCMECGWSEYEKYDLSDGKSPVQADGSVIDQYGGLHPTASSMAKAYRMAEDCAHILYKTGDADAPNSIKDRNGEVVLDLCRLCGRAETELDT